MVRVSAHGGCWVADHHVVDRDMDALGCQGLRDPEPLANALEHGGLVLGCTRALVCER
jgi:hypothetical protein